MLRWYRLSRSRLSLADLGHSRPHNVFLVNSDFFFLQARHGHWGTQYRASKAVGALADTNSCVGIFWSGLVQNSLGHPGVIWNFLGSTGAGAYEPFWFFLLWGMTSLEAWLSMLWKVGCMVCWDSLSPRTVRPSGLCLERVPTNLGGTLDFSRGSAVCQRLSLLFACTD